MERAPKRPIDAGRRRWGPPWERPPPETQRADLSAAAHHAPSPGDPGAGATATGAASPTAPPLDGGGRRTSLWPVAVARGGDDGGHPSGIRRSGPPGPPGGPRSPPTSQDPRRAGGARAPYLPRRPQPDPGALHPERLGHRWTGGVAARRPGRHRPRPCFRSVGWSSRGARRPDSPRWPGWLRRAGPVPPGGSGAVRSRTPCPSGPGARSGAAG